MTAPLPAGAEMERTVLSEHEWNEMMAHHQRVQLERWFYELSYRHERALWRGRARAAGRRYRAALLAAGG